MYTFRYTDGLIHVYSHNCRLDIPIPFAWFDLFDLGAPIFGKGKYSGHGTLKSYFFLDFHGVFGETVRAVHLI